MPIKTSTVHQIKKELELLPKEVLVTHCLRMAKYKLENKELLHYLLFESNDEAGFIEEIKSEIINSFAEINDSTFYLIKKGIRKILKKVIKHIKHSGKKETEVELLICFCKEMLGYKNRLSRSAVMKNMYERQLINIHKAFKKLHEDIKLDYEDDLEMLAKGL